MDNDLISRSALKKAIAEFHQKENDRLHNPLWGSIDLNALNRLIDNAPTVGCITKCVDCERVVKIKEVIPQEWIPIKTRKLTEEEKEEYPDYSFMYDCKLPDDGEEVLVTSSCGYVRLDTFYRDDGCYFEYYCDEGDVVAWQPLPEPYKGVKDNER